MMAKLKRRIAPLSGFVAFRDYRRLAATGRYREGEVAVAGRLVRFSDGVGALHSIREIFVDEVYRFNASGPAPLIIDCGSNIGLSILYFKTRFPAAEVIGYEADPEMFALLRANVGDIAKVSLRNAAAWMGNETLTFFVEGSLAGSTEVDFRKAGRAVEVAGEDLREAIGDRMVDFLKLDIEGGENRVLPHIADKLGQVRNLFFEYHSSAEAPQRLDELLGIVRAAGFRVAINGAHCADHPFVEQVDRGFDLQLNVSCFRPHQSS